MANQNTSQKHQLIDKANSKILVLTSASAAIVTFSLVASYILVGQLNYQNKVIGKKKAALTQLEANTNSRDELVKTYKEFIGGTVNAIGGSPYEIGPQDGDNAKIVLDALPSKYDFPALTSSLEKIMKDQGVTITSITGTDDEVAQTDTGSATPQPIEMPFEISVKGNYKQIQKVAVALDRSIRPIQIQSIQITGNEGEMTMKITAKAYYQPERKLTIPTEVVK